VKENRKALFDALDRLPWHQAPIAHSATGCGHGRITTRTIQVLPAPEDLPFPHVSQVLLIERYVSDLNGNPVSAVATLGVASPAAGRASAADLARHVREQWAIEPREQPLGAADRGVERHMLAGGVAVEGDVHVVDPGAGHHDSFCDRMKRSQHRPAGWPGPLAER